MLCLTPENEAGSAESIFLDDVPYDGVIRTIYGMNNSFFPEHTVFCNLRNPKSLKFVHEEPVIAILYFIYRYYERCYSVNQEYAINYTRS